jgi:hypothetical protein
MSVRVDGVETTNSTYQADISVDLEWALEEERTYHGVMLCLYDREGTVMYSTDIGPFRTSNVNVDVTVLAPERPDFVVVDHPELRANGFRQIRYWNEEQGYWSIGTHADLPFTYPRTDEAGRCG